MDGSFIILMLLVGILLIRKSSFFRFKSPESKRIEFYNELKDFFYEKIKESVVLIHTTSRKHVVNKILSEGFRFSDTLHNKTHQLTNDLTHLSYLLNQYKDYGNYVIVITIRRDIYSLLKELDEKDEIIEPIEFALCDYYPEEELNYLLPSMFVWGYIDFESYEIKENNQYLVGYDFNKMKLKIAQKISNKTSPNMRYM